MSVKIEIEEKCTVEEYLSEMEYADRTRINYRSACKGFISCTQGKDIEEIKDLDSEMSAYVEFLHEHDKKGKQLKKDIEGYISTRKEGNGGNTVYNQLHMVMNYLARNDIEIPSTIKKSWSRNIGNKESKTKEKPFTREEMISTVKHADFMLKPILLFAISTGARPDEIISIETGDIEGRDVFIDGDITKCGYDRTAFLSDEAIEALNQWLTVGRKKYVHSVRNKTDGFKDDERIFPISYDALRDRFNDLMKFLGMEEFDNKTKRRKRHLHLTRKYARVNMPKGGGDNPEGMTKIILGHDLTENDKRYAKENKDVMREWFLEHGQKHLSMKEEKIIIKDSQSTLDRLAYLEKIFEHIKPEILEKVTI